MCLSNGDVTLRNGHWAHNQNGVRAADRNGFALTGTAAPAGGGKRNPSPG
jgi:hypothetical protein